MTAMAEPQVYTVDELAKLLRVNARTIYRALEAGELRSFRVGTQWRVTQEALDAYMRGKE